jgi:hypothetical protein
MLMPPLLSPPAAVELAALMAATWLLGRDLSRFAAGAAGAAAGAAAAVPAELPDVAGAKMLGMTLWLALALWLLSVAGAAGCGAIAVAAGVLTAGVGGVMVGAAGAGVAGTGAAAVCAAVGAPSSARRSAAAPLPFLADWENQ